jgi:hypothetical protein
MLTTRNPNIQQGEAARKQWAGFIWERRHLVTLKLCDEPLLFLNLFEPCCRAIWKHLKSTADQD